MLQLHFLDFLKISLLRQKKTSKANEDLLSVFFLAESLGKTIPELLYGESGPMSNSEYAYWMAYMKEKGRLQELASKNANKKQTGRADQEFKKTMGSGRQQ